MSKLEQNSLIKHADNIRAQIGNNKVKSEASIYGLKPFESIYESAENFCNFVSGIDVNNLSDSSYRDKTFRQGQDAFVLFCEITEFSKNLGLLIKSTLSELKTCCDKMCTVTEEAETNSNEQNNNEENDPEEMNEQDIGVTLKTKKSIAKKMETNNSNTATTTTTTTSNANTTTTNNATKDVKKTPVKKTLQKKTETKKEEQVEETKETEPLVEIKNDAKPKTTTTKSKQVKTNKSESNSTIIATPVIETPASTTVTTKKTVVKKTQNKTEDAVQVPIVNTNTASSSINDNSPNPVVNKSRSTKAKQTK